MDRELLGVELDRRACLFVRPVAGSLGPADGHMDVGGL
jgi:hypothetical protein